MELLHPRMDVRAPTSDWLLEPPALQLLLSLKAFATRQHAALLQRSPSGSACIIPRKICLEDDLFILNILVVGRGSRDEARLSLDAKLVRQDMDAGI